MNERQFPVAVVRWRGEQGIVGEGLGTQGGNRSVTPLCRGSIFSPEGEEVRRRSKWSSASVEEACRKKLQSCPVSSSCFSSASRLSRPEPHAGMGVEGSAGSLRGLLLPQLAGDILLMETW